MNERISFCSCDLESRRMHGANGWHWQVNPRYPEWPQMDIAMEVCPAFMSALQRERADTASRRPKDQRQDRAA